MAIDLSNHAPIQSVPTRQSFGQRLRQEAPPGSAWNDPRRLSRGLGWFSIGLGLAEILAPSLVASISGTRNHRGLTRFYGLRELAAGYGILNQPANPGPWLWSRVAGDIVDLATLGAALTDEENDRGKTLFAFASVAGVTALDVLCARHFSGESAPSEGALHVEHSIIINRTPQDVYNFWHDFEKLPRFMSYLQSVRTTGDRQSHWIARAPGDVPVEWDAEVVDDVPGQRISWQSLPSSSVNNSGSVEFEEAPNGRGTFVHVQIDFGNTAHALGAAIAALMGKHPEQIVNKDLRRLKALLETGEILTTEGQPSGRTSSTTWLDSIAR
jgi:uncharacterized membrane protein